MLFSIEQSILAEETLANLRSFDCQIHQCFHPPKFPSIHTVHHMQYLVDVELQANWAV